MGPAATRKNPNLHKRAFFTPGVGKALHTVGKDETTLKYAPPPKKKGFPSFAHSYAGQLISSLIFINFIYFIIHCVHL